MGYGDPDHQHPLTLQQYPSDKEVTCFRCELPFDPWDWHYECTDCYHFVHQLCFELPHNMKHPLHPQHPLTLFPSPILQTDCSICHDPCLGGYTYQCQTCPTFSLHLKCFITIHLEEKHGHPLTLYGLDVEYRYRYSDSRCRTCGFPFDDIDSYIFECRECEFFIHFECAFLPSKVKRHHGHELTFEYNYPKESDLSYCDVCEDKYDEEPIDRTLSYYYCKICDYIAHVHCVTTKPDKATTQFENFVHEHPMIYSRKPRMETSAECACKKRLGWNESFYFCSQCNYKLHKSCAEFPRLIKHPHHKDHTLSLGSCASLNKDAELSVCGFCSEILEDVPILLCIDCDYVEHLSCAKWFTHPHHVGNLLLTAGDNCKFRCDACGELGHGFRMSYSDNDTIQYDLHLECFALPGKIECVSHSHPLFLIASPTKIRPDFFTTFLCEICHTEADPNFWIYCCKQCNYIAHLKCTIGNFLSNVGSSNVLSSLISITQREKEQFVVTKPDQSICSNLKGRSFPYVIEYPMFTPTGLFISPKLPLGDDSEQIVSSVTDLDEPFVDILHCPKCQRPISSQAYSSITDWAHYNLKANILNDNNQTSLQQEPLTLLDEELVDKLYCPICNQLIFAPTCSCAECQIFFHKSCAELPRKYSDDPRHMFVLVSPSMLTVMLKSKCNICMDPIQGYAYVCRRCEIAVDVVCAIGSPLLKLENQKHSFFSTRYKHHSDCKACGNPFLEGSVFFKCGSYECLFYLHFECALLPYNKIHRIHHHPLVLEPCLNLLVDDYICDVCEKELNPCLWAYRCSDSCGDRATSHVSCIVTSNKKFHFNYSKECCYPNKDQLRSHVNYVKEKMAVADRVTALATAAPDEEFDLLYDNLFLLVDEIDHGHAYIITRMLINMDQTNVLHWIESPNELKAKVEDVMETFRVACAQPNNNDDDDENLRIMRSWILKFFP